MKYLLSFILILFSTYGISQYPNYTPLPSDSTIVFSKMPEGCTDLLYRGDPFKKYFIAGSGIKNAIDNSSVIVTRKDLDSLYLLIKKLSDKIEEAKVRFSYITFSEEPKFDTIKESPGVYTLIGNGMTIYVDDGPLLTPKIFYDLPQGTVHPIYFNAKPSHILYGTAGIITYKHKRHLKHHKHNLIKKKNDY